VGRKRASLAAPPPDPFGERRAPRWRQSFALLGARIEFATDSRRLLRIVRSAFAGLPPQYLPGRPAQLRLRLALTGTRGRGRGEPAAVRTLSAPGLLCGTAAGADFVAINHVERSALVSVGHEFLASPYHARYELLEFAVYVLAARARQLVPLHAACLGADGAGVLVMGASGSGKSTLLVQALLEGLTFLAEDSVLIEPHQLLATGIASFAHLKPDSLRFVPADARSRLIRSGTVIRRRSGVRKLEIDLRRSGGTLAARPLRIGAVVFLSAGRSRGPQLLTRLATAEVLRRLAASQRYAAAQPGWRRFRAAIARLPGYELRRGGHPRQAVAALRTLLPSRDDAARSRVGRAAARH
jgi:hypothetical protein